MQDLRVVASYLKIWSQFKINSAVQFDYVSGYFKNLNCFLLLHWFLDAYFRVLIHFLRQQLGKALFSQNYYFTVFPQALLGFEPFTFFIVWFLTINAIELKDTEKYM